MNAQGMIALRDAVVGDRSAVFKIEHVINDWNKGKADNLLLPEFAVKGRVKLKELPAILQLEGVWSLVESEEKEITKLNINQSDETMFTMSLTRKEIDGDKENVLTLTLYLYEEGKKLVGTYRLQEVL